MCVVLSLKVPARQWALRILKRGKVGPGWRSEQGGGGDQGAEERRPRRGVREERGTPPHLTPRRLSCLLTESLGGCEHLVPRPSSLPGSLRHTRP